MLIRKALTIRLIAILLDIVASLAAPACSRNDEKNNCLRSTSDQSNKNKQQTQCRLYIGPNVEHGGFSLYSGIDRSQHETLGESELVLSMIDPNKNEFSLWHNYVWNSTFFPEALLEPYQHIHDMLLSGIGFVLPCAEGVSPNLVFSNKEMINDCESIGGGEMAVSCYDNLEFVLTQNIKAGEAIVLGCTDNSRANNSDESIERPQIVPLDWLQTNGVCFDNFEVAKSSISGAGRGAFTKRAVAQGDVIAVSPVMHLDRSQTDIVRQSRIGQQASPLVRDHGIVYTSEVVTQQLIINYSFGHPKSNVLFFPIAPGVNFINHAEEANAYIRWSTRGPSVESMNEMPVMELLEIDELSLVFDFVALRDIVAGEEIFIDYGNDWKETWSEWTENGNLSKTSFRREIGLPDNFIPSRWMRYEPSTAVPDFIANPLQPGYIAPVRWLDTKEVVTPNAFRIGLNSTIRNVLMEYANRVGVTKLLTSVTKEGNELEPESEIYVELDGQKWELQRPESAWRSNLHWLSPGGDEAHQNYLQALSLAGFDDILESLGHYLAMDGLAVFHVTFIATSYSSKGYMHTDFAWSENKGFNIIIPLILANETDPELDISSLDQERTGRYKYEYDVAVAIGDLATHGTSAVDYRWNKEMRLAATIYVADFNERNVENITNYVTQAYPPSNKDLFLSWSGIHWNPEDPSRKLPKPNEDHILLQSTTYLVK